MVERHPFREGRPRRVLVRLVADHRDSAHPLGVELAGDLRDGDLALHHCALDRLSSGHGDRAVGQNLVGDVDVGGDRRANRQQPRVKVGAVAQVLEDVRRFGERRLADPVGPLAAHLGDRQGPAFGHPHRHAVTPDSAQGDALVRNLRRDVVGTSRAEGGQAHQGRGRVARGLRRRSQVRGGLRDPMLEPAANRLGDDGRAELALRRNQRGAGLIDFAEQSGPICQVVEQAGQLLFHQRALLLDDEEVLEAAGETLDALGLEGPAHRHLVDR